LLLLLESVVALQSWVLLATAAATVAAEAVPGAADRCQDTWLLAALPLLLLQQAIALRLLLLPLQASFLLLLGFDTPAKTLYCCLPSLAAAAADHDQRLVPSEPLAAAC